MVKVDLQASQETVKSNNFRPHFTICLLVLPLLFSSINEYRNAFGTKARIPRTPDLAQSSSRSQNGASRPTSRGLGSMDPPPQPQFSESGPRPSSAGKTSG